MLRRFLENRPGFHTSKALDAQLAAASVDELEAWFDQLCRGQDPGDVFDLSK